MRFKLLLLLLLLLFSSKSFSQNTLVEHAARNAVKVRVPGYMGSGVYLGDKFILTAWHVVQTSPDYGAVYFRDGVRIEFKVVLRDTIWDQAILELESQHPWLPGVGVSLNNPQVNQKVYAVGFGAGYRIYSGVVLGYSGTSRASGKDWFRFNHPAIPGDSGGPILDEQGNLIGPLWGTTPSQTVASVSGRFQQFAKPIFPALVNWRSKSNPRQILPQSPPSSQPSPQYPPSVDPSDPKTYKIKKIVTVGDKIVVHYEDGRVVQIGTTGN